MKVFVSSYYTTLEVELEQLEKEAASFPDVLLISKGDKVVKVCATKDFTSDLGMQLFSAKPPLEVAFVLLYEPKRIRGWLYILVSILQCSVVFLYT